MTRAEQKKFVKVLSRTIVQEICDQIDRDKIPAEWDGHELRVLLCHRAGEHAKISEIVKDPTGQRSWEYHNTVAVKNLI